MCTYDSIYERKYVSLSWAGKYIQKFMKISINWLKDYINIKQSPKKIADSLTMGIAEVEDVIDLADKYKNIIVGEVLLKEKHPNADKLSKAQVSIGKEKLNIVCGASNLEKGQKVPVALVGAILPGDFKIEKAKIRGEESNGMICAEEELGLAKKSEGIMVLDENAKVGQKFSVYMGLDDIILDIDNKSLTHRADLFCHIGIARELSALLNLKLNLTKLKKPKAGSDYKIQIEVKDKKLCPRYMGVVLDNIEIRESPKWMQARLDAAGMRPINNIVDITNYVMLEYGQPLHAFDFNKIKNIAFANNNPKVDQNKLKRVIVRSAKKNESIVTIDNKKRNLDESMLAIADEREPIAIAGVMGGLNSEVDEKTKTILLEAANFDGTSVRKTSQKLGLRSEAVLRFEKGQSVDLPEYGLYRACELFEKYAEARVSSNIVDTLKSKPKEIKIKLDLDYIERLIGIKIPKAKIVNILKSLEFGVTQSKEYLNIEVPIYRTDIKAEEDLVEEIARVYGYDDIEPQEIKGVLKPIAELPDLFWGRKIEEYLEGAGFSEVYNYSFYGEKLLKKCLLSTKDHLIVSNAGSQDLKYLRTILIPRLLENAETNFRNYDEFKIFEIGHVYFNSAIECKSLSGIVVGNREDVFYKAKGTLEFLLEKLNIKYRIEELEKTKDCEYWNMYAERQAIQFLFGKDILGTMSMCNSQVINNFNLKNKKVAFFNFSIDQLSSRATLNKQFKPLPKYPSITLDLAFVLNKSVKAKEVEDLIKKTGGDLLKELELFDVYAGKGLEPNTKSLAFHLMYRADDRTLKDEEARQTQNKIIKRLESELGAKIRG